MDKSPDAFRTISEVAEELDLPQHVLRFWETRFAQIRPLKRGGGRRYYRPDDIDLLKGIRTLLYGEGYTIRGVQRIFKAEGIRFVQAIGRGEQSVTPAADAEDEAADLPATEPLDASARLPRPALPTAAFQRLRGALDELHEADRVLSTLKPVDGVE
ncbi:MAG TPA: MerR family transcriptional regulator [Microvirga sp.]|jgi:DNA-binding transcriptional MerR regulator